ncbi:MAG: FeoA family protein [Deltaproteobacteria bacterium]|nr:MAG: FeoA family protein [Deltaproteobacteria bacterium]
MNIPLIDAPKNTTLLLSSVKGTALRHRLRRMGLFEGEQIVRLDEEVRVQPVRIRSEKGTVVVSGGMAMKIVVHLDDGRKLPLMEMNPREQGHIEGVTCGRALQSALAILGIDLDARITFVRRLPPMEYVVETADAGLLHLPEGMAAKVVGTCGGKKTQLVQATSGEPFVITHILGGKGGGTGMYGMRVGDELMLNNVRSAQALPMGQIKSPVIVTSPAGLRLFFERMDAAGILVQLAEQPDEERPES